MYFKQNKMASNPIKSGIAILSNINAVVYLWMIALLSACGASGEKTKPLPVNAPAAKKETLFAEYGKLSASVQIPGELIAFQQVDLYAKVNSFVQKLYVDVGSAVKQGQLLAAMDAPEIGAQLSGAASRLEALEATYAASKANYERLLETSKTPGTISPNDLDMALARQKSDYAQLQSAKASKREISDTRNYLTIRAPFSGIITARNVSTGAYVGPAGKGSEMPIFTLQQQSKLRLVVSVPEAYSPYLKAKDTISFRITSLPGTSFSGTVQRLAGALDTRIRSQRVEADVDNASGKLLPGMVANVQFLLPGRDSAIILPRSAVGSNAEGVYVIKVVNGKARKTPVSKGREANGNVEVFGDIAAGDRLVKMASDEIREGEEIN